MATEPAGGFTDEVPLERSVATLVESWAYLASGSPGAELVKSDGAAIAAFIRSPDREVLNNAILSRAATSRRRRRTSTCPASVRRRRRC